MTKEDAKIMDAFNSQVSKRNEQSALIAVFLILRRSKSDVKFLQHATFAYELIACYE